MKRLEQIQQDFIRALAALEEADRQAKTDLEIDGAIQRFEFTFELYWKLLKVYLEGEGVIVRTPRESLKEAFRLGIIEDESVGLQMLEDRNSTVHLYDKNLSRSIFENARNNYLKLFRVSLEKMGLKK
jgi:nucleotidyltransferase substrate binding protein (TIGR01987 family)